LILWTIFTVYLVYLLGATVSSKKTGLLAALFYAVLSADIYLMGDTAETELFANLPRIAGVLAFVHIYKLKAKVWKYVFVGMLGGVAILFKSCLHFPLSNRRYYIIGGFI
jgi:4-amino-4-deoxy-L-arabinose transferase-like glycosyltransferase